MRIFDRLLPPSSPSHEQFANLMIDACKRRGIDGPFDYDASDFKLRIHGKYAGMFWMSNAYQDYCTVGRRDRPKLLNHYAQTIKAGNTAMLPETFGEALPQILPRIRERVSYEIVKLQTDDPDMVDVPTQIVGEYFTVEPVCDFPNTIASLTNVNLKNWGVTLEQALAAARENLWKISNEDFRQMQPGLYISPWQDHYDATRLYLHDLIWQLDVKGQHVVMAPHRDILLVTGSEDEDGLKRMCELAEEPLADDRGLMGFVLRLDGETWVPFRPDGDGPGSKAVRFMFTRSSGDMYGRQKEALQAALSKASQDIFVASVMASADQETGEACTTCSWTKGADSLLPKTDRIKLIVLGDTEEKKQARLANWDEAADVVGDLMETTDYFPARFRVREFPTDEQFERLGEPLPFRTQRSTS